MSCRNHFSLRWGSDGDICRNRSGTVIRFQKNTLDGAFMAGQIMGCQNHFDGFSIGKHSGIQHTELLRVLFLHIRYNGYGFP